MENSTNIVVINILDNIYSKIKIRFFIEIITIFCDK